MLSHFEESGGVFMAADADGSRGASVADSSSCVTGATIFFSSGSCKLSKFQILNVCPVCSSSSSSSSSSSFSESSASLLSAFSEGGGDRGVATTTLGCNG